LCPRSPAESSPTRRWRPIERIVGTYEKLKASEVPLLLLVADPGAIMKPEVIEQLQGDLPRMQTEEIGPGMHFVQETQPTTIGKAVDAWIAGLPAWSGAPK
jgi:haloalkane dehalogenase